MDLSLYLTENEKVTNWVIAKFVAKFANLAELRPLAC